VTFSASVSSGITIDWYNASSGGATVTGGYGVTSFSPSLTQTTTYYAESRNTSMNCVSSSRLSVTVTINQYGTAGSEPSTCGCAPGLTSSGDTCQAASSPFTACKGVTEVTATQTEGSVNWYDANTICANKGSGWRLPSYSELLCLCANKDSVPGGLSNYYYWTSDYAEGSTGGRLVGTSNCSTAFYFRADKFHAKCVK
jgi:hypothetical protein